MNENKPKLTLDRPVVYQIKVPGHLDQNWSDWTENMTLQLGTDENGQPFTTLTGAVDQSALLGILRWLNSLGLPLISVIYEDV